MKKQFKTGANGTTNGKPTTEKNAKVNTATLAVYKQPEITEVDKSKNEPLLEQPEQSTEAEKTTEGATALTVKPKTIAEILEKNNRMNKILERRANIDAAAKQLDSFNLGTNKLGDTLLIKDAKGNSFSTSKTDLIEAVVDLLQNRVAIETEKVEQEALLLEAA